MMKKEVCPVKRPERNFSIAQVSKTLTRGPVFFLLGEIKGADWTAPARLCGFS
jgi:hypothetical protein